MGSSALPNPLYSAIESKLCLSLSVMAFYSLIFTVYLLLSSSFAFQSDELLADDEEFGIEGAQIPTHARSSSSSPSPSPSPSPSTTSTSRRRFSDSDSDSKVQFQLEHAFGDTDFTLAGTFTARLKTWSHGGQTLTKLRFSRNAFTEDDQQNFKNLLEADDFYRIRLPSNVLSSPGTDYVFSSVKARCLPRESLNENFLLHTEGVNIIAVSYGAPGACPYPRQVKLPAKWSFSSHTVLKSSEQAPRTPVFVDEHVGDEIGEGEAVKPPEKSFWAKYWMYLIPLGLIVMNAVTQAMNMPEEQGAGQQPGGAVQRGPSSAARR